MDGGVASPRAAAPPGTGKGLGVAPVEAQAAHAITIARPSRSRNGRTNVCYPFLSRPSTVSTGPLTVTSHGVYSFAALTPLQPIGHNGRKAPDRRIRMEQTLLLNASYEPLKIVHWQKAVTLWCQGKVEVISVYDREIRAVSFSFKLPSVIRLLRYIKIKPRFD